MADRVVRDELLRSERYWSVGIEAQRMFIHLLLCVDGYGRFSGKNYTVRAACFPGQAVEPAKVDKMLVDLNDADLIRLYEVAGERYIVIPRFNQRLRYKNPSKYPDPPFGISALSLAKSDTCQERVGHVSDTCPPKRSEVKRSNTFAASEKISLSAEGVWSAISAEQKALWKRAYPALSLDLELARAAAWIVANPSNRKSNYARFITNWLTRSQDRAPKVVEEGSSRMGKFEV